MLSFEGSPVGEAIRDGEKHGFILREPLDSPLGMELGAKLFAPGVDGPEPTAYPIGLLQEAVGGVPAETFTSIDALRPLKDFDAHARLLIASNCR